MRCPNCGSSRIHTHTSSHENSGFSGVLACLGFLLFNWIGLLCGLCGGKEKYRRTENFCQDCGKRF